MVTSTRPPALSWPEAADPVEIDRLSGEIVTTMTSKLSPPGERRRLFFVIPTPSAREPAEATYVAAVARAGGAPRHFRAVTMPTGGRCYVFADASLLQSTLVNAFDIGAPELTLVAVNCDYDLHESESSLAQFVLSILKDAGTSFAGEVVGMHFDSGDLVEVF